MNNFTFKTTTAPSTHEIDFLTQKINEEAESSGKAYPFAIHVQDETGEMIAGCNGSIIFGAIYTDQLWVHPAQRGKGIGVKLMQHVHAFGKEQGCKLATVTTMSFQAPGFYEKLGYTIDFSQEGYENNSTCVYLSRNL